MLDERQMMNMKSQPKVSTGKRKFYVDGFDEIEAERREIAVKRTKAVVMVPTPYGPKPLVILHQHIRATSRISVKAKPKKIEAEEVGFDTPRSAMPGTISGRQYHGKSDLDAERKAG